MQRVVPDASVILKWALPLEGESHSGRALALREEIVAGRVHPLLPSFWYFEVANTLARKEPRLAPRQLPVLRQMQMEEMQFDDALESRALLLVERHAVSFYHAAYHALALDRQALFVTADEKYLARAGAAGRILHLREWPLH